jgi:hypothetical protein
MLISRFVSGVGASTRDPVTSLVVRHHGSLTRRALVVSTGHSSDITEVTSLPFGQERLAMTRASVSRL